MAETEIYLTTDELAKRWGYLPSSIRSMRFVGRGPRYLKLNGRVRYRLEDIEAYEAESVIDPAQKGAEQ